MHIWSIILVAWFFYFQGFTGRGEIIRNDRFGPYLSKTECNDYYKATKLGNPLYNNKLPCYEAGAVPVIDETPRATLVDPALPRTQAELNDLLMQQPVPQ